MNHTIFFNRTFNHFEDDKGNIITSVEKYLARLMINEDIIDIDIISVD